MEGLKLSLANDLGRSGELGADRVDEPCVPREPASILRRIRRLAEAATVLELHGQEVTERHGEARPGRTAQEVFNPRALARSPGGLEPVAGFVDLARGSGRIDPVGLHGDTVHTHLPRFESCCSNVPEKTVVVPP
jgi:hypothetical protein